MAEVKWDEEIEASFQALKKCLVSSPVLKYPDFSKQFFIETDASNSGIGAVLSQEYEIDLQVQKLPVAFASRLLKPAEKNYSTTDKESLAIIWAVKNFKLYIYGMKFTIIIAHSALKALKDKSIL